jgi:hypothetical protein
MVPSMQHAPEHFQWDTTIHGESVQHGMQQSSGPPKQTAEVIAAKRVLVSARG